MSFILFDIQEQCFNTSYVSVQVYSKLPNTEAKKSFNTSYVSVQVKYYGGI